MSIKLAFAAVLRALRSTKEMPQEGLTETTSRAHLVTLEQGKASPSLDKLYALSEALELTPLTLMTLTLSLHENEPVEALVERLKSELATFDAAGGREVLEAQLVDGKLVSRPAGKTVNAQRLYEVRQCKADGLSQKQTALKLSLSKSTVHDLWKR